MFRKGCLAVCFLLWRLFDCSSTTAAAATSSCTSSRQQQGAAGSSRQQAAAGSSRQQQAAAGRSRQQQTPAEAAAGSSRQAAAGSSKQQQPLFFFRSRRQGRQPLNVTYTWQLSYKTTYYDRWTFRTPFNLLTWSHPTAGHNAEKNVTPRSQEVTNHLKNTVFHDFSTSSRTCIFFPLTLSLLWSSFFFSFLLLSSLTLPTSAFPSIHIVGSLTSKPPLIISERVLRM